MRLIILLVMLREVGVAALTLVRAQLTFWCEDVNGCYLILTKDAKTS